MVVTRYEPGDWITLTEPDFLYGARAIVVDVRVKRMSVAYLDLSDSVQQRDVPIDSVRSGHNDRPRGLAAVTDSLNEMKLVHAKELMEFAIEHRLIDSSTALTVLSDYSASVSVGREREGRARIDADQGKLREWLASRT